MTSPDELGTEDALADYRARVIATHESSFDYHHEVARTLESAIQTSRPYPTHVHLVLDILMVQAFKSHAAVSLLAQHGLMEDTAVMTRRLLELAVQGAYIGMESDEAERKRRAGRLAAFMWRQLPSKLKKRLPPDVRRMWVGLGRGYGRFVAAKAKRWGPTFFDMFREIGSERLYREDYSLLSAIAHGTGEHQVFQFATFPIRLHRDDYVPVLLKYSSRYYLNIGHVWNSLFSILKEGELEVLGRDP